MRERENKIDANDKTLDTILSNQKYMIDYFQRGYLWEEKHIEQLISDLTSAFLSDYDEKHLRGSTEEYRSYFMGTIILNNKDNKKSIIDGQQRLTSLTLLLIYLNNLQQEENSKKNVESLILSAKYGTESFNLNIEGREECFRDLYKNGYYQRTDKDTPSITNMVNRYEDIGNFFPHNEINGKAILMFLDWLRYNVILIEIQAYSDENTYAIFETMNDRGLSLTPTEMLKGYILSKIYNVDVRNRHNAIWKENVAMLQSFDKTEDQKFIQAWLRAKYAETIRPSKQGSQNEDFEKIGTQFHNWFKGNLEKIGLGEEDSQTPDEFLEKNFAFYFKAYKMILESSQTFDKDLEHVYYIKDWGIGASLIHPLLLAPLELGENEATIKNKMNIVAKYIEAFAVRRSINHRNFAASSIRYTMCLLVKEIRKNNSLDELKLTLENKLNDMGEKWEGLLKFEMNTQNKKFVKFLLSRISSYIDKESGISNDYDDYYRPEIKNKDKDKAKAKPFEIEHIWANKFERHTEDFDDKSDFEKFRNRIGDLVLLPRGTNQSYNDDSYESKLEHYTKENLLVCSLTPICYEKNPNFTNMIKGKGLNFTHYESFPKSAVEERGKLYRDICKLIWGKL